MHQDEPCTAGDSNRGHPRVAPQRRHVIDDVGSSFESGLGNSGFGGVDGDRCLRSGAERLDHWKNPVDFLLGCHRESARPGRLSSDIEDGGSLPKKVQPMLASCRRVEEDSSV